MRGEEITFEALEAQRQRMAADDASFAAAAWGLRSTLDAIDASLADEAVSAGEDEARKKAA